MLAATTDRDISEWITATPYTTAIGRKPLIDQQQRIHSANLEKPWSDVNVLWLGYLVINVFY